MSALNPEQYVPQELLFDQGKKVVLRRGGLPSEDGFFTESKIVREWYVLMQPTVQSIDALTAVGVFWNVIAEINAAYVSTSGVRLLRPLTIESKFRVPIQGICIPIHGSFVQLKFERTVAAVAPQVDVELLIFGLPGVPRPWSFPELVVLAGVGPFVGTASVLTFAREFTISGDIAAGDTLEQLAPNGTVIQTVLVTSDYANNPQPIDPDANRLRYTSAVAKRLLFNYYFRT